MTARPPFVGDPRALLGMSGEEHPFTGFMDPDVNWIAPSAFDIAFDDVSLATPDDPVYVPETARDTLTQESKMTAHTNAVDPRTGANETYPGFINIRFERGLAILTVRGDPPLNDDNVATGESAEQVELTIEQTDWDQFVSEATRERGLVPGG